MAEAREELAKVRNTDGCDVTSIGSETPSCRFGLVRRGGMEVNRRSYVDGTPSSGLSSLTPDPIYIKGFADSDRAALFRRVRK
eukprot:287789-Rhodomonas_salina.2